MRLLSVEGEGRLEDEDGRVEIEEALKILGKLGILFTKGSICSQPVI